MNTLNKISSKGTNHNNFEVQISRKDISKIPTIGVPSWLSRESVHEALDLGVVEFEPLVRCGNYLNK